MELPKDRSELLTANVNDRVERQHAPQPLVANRQPPHVACEHAIETTARQLRHLGTEIEAKDGSAELSDEDADLAGSASDFEDWIAHARREAGKHRTVARLAAHLVEELRLVAVRDRVIRRSEPVPCHRAILADAVRIAVTRAASNPPRHVGQPR